MKEVGNYRLTESYLHHGFAYILHNAKHPCQHHASKMGFAIFRNMATEPLDKIIARYDASPGTHAELAKYGLTARQAVVGGLVMMVIGLDRMSDTSGGKRSGMTGSGRGLSTPAMKANKAFYEAHLPEIKAFHHKMGVIAKKVVDDNGGKLPACMMQEFKHH